jgi:hypothetical protein
LAPQTIYYIITVKQKRAKTMKATLIHSAFENEAVRVAEINVADMQGTEALEYVFRVTQNLEGSWSKGPAIEWDGEIHNNPDFNPNITVTEPLKVGKNGNTYGHRSTSVGDYVLLGEELWRVAYAGFEPAQEVKTRECF